MPSQEPIHLFVYGTLTDPECVVSLTGKRFAGIHVTLEGFERVESPLGYPFILPRSGAVVHGLLLHDIDPVSLARLDDYEAEGDLYRRQSVEVEAVGARLFAMAYVGHRIGAAGPPL
jgi:gamma-glutamylaminecyclotransferase